MKERALFLDRDGIICHMVKEQGIDKSNYFKYNLLQ